MKKIIALLAVITLLPFFVNPSEGNERLNIIDKGEYCLISLGGMDYAVNPGHPMLPYRTEIYTFPMGTKINGIEVREKNVERINLEKKIMPSPMPAAIGEGSNIKEGKIYSTDTFYPSSWYDYRVGMGIRNGERVVILSVHLYPVRYNAVRNEVMHAESFSINIDYEAPSESMKREDAYDFLIIAPDDWLTILKTLKDFKDGQGISTIVVGLNEIYSGKYFAVEGRDEAEKIKYFIKNAIENWGIEYVMLVGDVEKMPVRYVDTGIEDIPTAPSDLYFADIYDASGAFSSWDKDGDGKFGERKDDRPDLYPDVYIGRLPASSTSDLSLLINRIKSYVTPPRRALMVGVELFWDTDNREGEYLKETVSSEINLDTIKLYETDDYERDGIANEEEIADWINNGVMLLNFASHGSPYGMGWNAGHFTIDDLSLLHNSFMPVAFAMACSTNEFDVEGYDCLGEMFLLNAQGGGIAYAGSSRVAYVYLGSAIKSGLSGYLDVAFFKGYYDGNNRVGEMFAAAKEAYVSHIPFMGDADLLTMTEYNLMGDPTIELPPMPLTSRASVDKEISSSSVNITADVTDNGTVELYYRKKTNLGGRWYLYGSLDNPPYKWEFSPEEDGYYEFYTILKKDNYTEQPPYVADAHCIFGISQPAVKFIKPVEGELYLFNKEVASLPFHSAVIIGATDIQVEGNASYIELYLDDEFLYSEKGSSCSWKLDGFLIGRHTIKAVAYNLAGEESSEEVRIWALII